MQGFLQEECPEEARLQLQVLQELHGGQGQEEPVQILQTQEMFQGWHEEGCCPEREGQDQQENTNTGGINDRSQWTVC